MCLENAVKVLHTIHTFLYNRLQSELAYMKQEWDAFHTVTATKRDLGSGRTPGNS